MKGAFARSLVALVASGSIASCLLLDSFDVTPPRSGKGGGGSGIGGGGLGGAASGGGGHGGGGGEGAGPCIPMLPTLAACEALVDVDCDGFACGEALYAYYAGAFEKDSYAQRVNDVGYATDVLMVAVTGPRIDVAQTGVDPEFEPPLRGNEAFALAVDFAAQEYRLWGMASGPGSESMVAVAPIDDDHVIALGRTDDVATWSDGGATFGAAGVETLFVARASTSTGDWLAYSSDADVRPGDVAVDPVSGAVVVAGSITGMSPAFNVEDGFFPVSVQTSTETSYDAFLGLFDGESGALLDSLVFDGPFDEHALSLAYDAMDNLHALVTSTDLAEPVTIWSISANFDSGTPHSLAAIGTQWSEGVGLVSLGSDLLVAANDPDSESAIVAALDGNETFTEIFELKRAVLHAIATMADGHLVLSGSSSGSFTVAGEKIGGAGAFVLKLSTEPPTVHWAKRLPLDRAPGLTANAAGFIAVGGWLDGVLSDPGPAWSGPYDPGRNGVVVQLAP